MVANGMQHAMSRAKRCFTVVIFAAYETPAKEKCNPFVLARTHTNMCV